MVLISLRLTFTTFLLCYFVTASPVFCIQSKNQIYSEETNITLQCTPSNRNNSLTIWLDEEQNTTIFIGKTRNTTQDKFSNFDVSNVSNDNSLYIYNANVSDEGNYTCKEEGMSETFGVRIEATPKLFMHVNNETVTNTSHGATPVTFGDVTLIQCKAIKAKPVVNLEFKIGDGKWIQPVNVTYKQDEAYTTTETVFVHNVSSHSETEVACRTTGQFLIPHVTAWVNLNVMYVPICAIQRIEDLVICNCDANPPVNQYNILVNGELKATDKSLRIDPIKNANITCFASNMIGTGKSTCNFVAPNDEAKEHDSQIKRLGVLTIIIVAVPCMTGTLFWYLQRQKLTKKAMKKSSNHSNLELRPKDHEAEEIAMPMLPANETERSEKGAEHIL